MAKKSTQTITLLNEHVFTFIAVLIIGAIVISIYMVIAPEKDSSFNFSPFPKIAPTQLPDPNRPTDSCWNTLTKCDTNGECSACSLDEYECKTVSQEQADAKFYHYNGINVPAGKWCLPKDHNPNPTCNTYTGRYMWVFDPEYCNSITPGKDQCWKCECLYPSLFGDPTTGCTAQLACQNDSTMSNTLEQKDNQLTPSKCALSTLQGQGLVWNPGIEQKNTGPLYQYTPYDTDLQGNPMFTCDCRANVGGQYFSELPGDPHTCHLEPCYKSLGYSSKGLDNCTDDCGKPASCSCACESTNVAMSPSGKYKGTCVLIGNSCSNFGYIKNEDQTGQCDCPPPNWEQKCRSPNTGVNMDKPELPECVQPENALGSECVDPCEGAVCEHGAVCVSCGPNAWENNPMCALDTWLPISADSEKECNNLCTDYKCDQSVFGKQTHQDGSVTKTCYLLLKNHKQTHAQCDCRTAKTAPGKPFSGWNGATCEVACLPGGHRVKSHLFGSSCDCYKCSCCCSQNDHKSGDFWGIAYHEDCDDGYAYPPDPAADPSCAPAEDCSAQTKTCGESLSC